MKSMKQLLCVALVAGAAMISMGVTSEQAKPNLLADKVDSIDNPEDYSDPKAALEHSKRMMELKLKEYERQSGKSMEDTRKRLNETYDKAYEEMKQFQQQHPEQYQKMMEMQRQHMKQQRGQ